MPECMPTDSVFDGRCGRRFRQMILLNLLLMIWLTSCRIRKQPTLCGRVTSLPMFLELFN